MIIGIENARKYPDDELVWVTPNGRVFKRVNQKHPERKQWLEYKPQLDKDGYCYLRLGGKKWLIHRLVYSLFVGELLPGMVVCHRNGCRSDNQKENLLQATQKANISHKLGHGTHQKGENHPRSTHTNAQIENVKKALSTARQSTTGRLGRGEALRISRETGSSLHTIHDVSSKRAWA